jgi:septal ring factor EnvC (AmiA/AmiB activator)
MKRVMVVLFAFALFTCCAVDAQPKKDTTVTLSLPALDGKIKQFNEQLAQSQKNLDDAQKFVEQTKQNILQIQAILSTLETVKKDTALQIKNKNESLKKEK